MDKRGVEELCDHYFDNDGVLRYQDGTRFNFNAYDNPDKNQERYEALGLAIENYVYKLLEKNYGLSRFPVPKKGDGDDRSFVFTSSRDLDCDTLMILINGSGVVRAGQWARSLIINHSLESGTQLPYIERAQRAGWGVLVMNTNHNCRGGKYIRGSRSPKDHATTVWKDYVMNAKASKIVIVAHSYGGVVTSSLFHAFRDNFTEKVIAIAFTDSAHHLWYPQDQRYIKKVACNWVTSSKAVGTEVANSEGCPCVSAGTSVHEETSWKAIEGVFLFINDHIEGISKPVGRSANGKQVAPSPPPHQQVTHNDTSSLLPAEGSKNPTAMPVNRQNATGIPSQSENVKEMVKTNKRKSKSSNLCCLRTHKKSRDV